MREDNSEKTAWHALHKLIHEDWKTHETLLTDADGVLSFTGFKGGYRLRTDAGSAVCALEKDMETQVRLSR